MNEIDFESINELVASLDAENRKLTKALREAVRDIERGPVETVLGHDDIHSSQIPVKSVARWKKILGDGNR